jgi:hypothetical protein
MFQEKFGKAQELIAAGDHKHGGQELYESIFKARDAADLRAVRSVVEQELERAGWRQRGRYKELRRVVEKRMEKVGDSVAA